MATPVIHHSVTTGAAANPDVLVDGVAWDAVHTVTGLENVPNVDTTNASNLSSGTVPAARMPGLTGDVTTSLGTVATTLATVNANVGTFGSATQSVQFTANGKGLLTAAANVTITPAIGSVTGLGTGVSTFLAAPSSANLRAALTDEVGTGAAYFVGGALGTPASGTATNLTGTASGLTAGTVTTNANLTGAVTSVGNATSLGSFSSANLATALSDETGSGSNVFATSPTITTPSIVGRTPTSATVTISNASPGVVTWTSHGLAANAPVFFSTSGALPTGLTAAVPPSAGTFSANTYLSNPTLYYVVGSSITTNTFQVSATVGGAAINTSSAGSGTHTAFANAMVPTGSIGERIWNIIPIASSVAAVSGSAGQVWNTISLTTGIWKVGGRTGVIKQGAGTPVFSHMHAGIVYGFSTIPSSPFNSTTAAHITSNDPNGWVLTNDPTQIFLTGTTTINAVATTDFAPTTANTAGFYGETWAERVG